MRKTTPTKTITKKVPAKAVSKKPTAKAAPKKVVPIKAPPKPARKAPAKKAVAQVTAKQAAQIKKTIANDKAAPIEVKSNAVQPKPNGFTPSPQQQVIFDWVKKGQGNAFIEAVAGAGKEQPLYAKVYTPTGPKRMGDLKVGDSVCTPTGTANVVAIHPQGRKPIYRVHFRDRSYADCGLDHLWTIRRADGDWRTVPLSSFLNDLLRSSNAYKWQIPLAPTQYAKQKLPIDPYVLGYILANGTFTGNVCEITSHEDDVVDIHAELEPRLPTDVELGEGRYTSNKGVAFTIKKKDRYDGKPNSVMTALKELAPDPSNKHIPTLYLLSSLEDRWALLRGLMDGDGSCSANRTRFCTSSERMRDGVITLVQSLGGTAIWSPRPMSKRPNEYQINVKCFEVPFSLPRKANRWQFSWKNPPSRYITKVEKLEECEQQCIKLDDGIGLYFTDNHIITHNTTTLVEALRLMPGSVAFTAYNKKIAVEIQQKTQRLVKQNLRVGTFHSFGFNAWRRIHRSVRVDDRAKRDMMLTYCEVPEKFHSIVQRLVSLGKQSGVYKLWNFMDEHEWLAIMEHHDMDSDLENPRDIEYVIKHAINCIRWSRNNCMHVIDFDDMIWLPVITEVPMDQYQWVLVDEAQDTNPARRLLAAKMLAPGGRLIMVGDRYQAIYGFTGADNDAVDIIIREFRCKQLPLTVTYRCPKTIVAEAQKFVPHIIAHETAPQGIVRGITAKEFTEKDIPTLDPNDAILCRKTKPLIELAFNLIRRHIPCHVEGRDIGQGLMKLACRWKIKTVDKLRERLEAYQEREVEKLKQLKRDASADALNDRVETLYVLMEGCHTVDEVVRKIEQMFQDTDGTQKRTVTLSTVHKSKGREWDRVYILGWSEYMPSQWAKAEWQREQERNLQYVAVTRSKGELVLLEALDKAQEGNPNAKALPSG